MIRSYIKKALILLFAAAVMLSLIACGKTKRPQEEIIKELTLCHASYGAEAADKESELLKELKSIDPLLEGRWREILRYWDYANSTLKINYEILPEGLPENEELCLVALGFQLKEDGSMKPELEERLKVVKACAEKYPKACIVCTGGGTAANNKSVTEAGEMAKWLEAQGISKERILIEDRSITTAQNAMYTYELLALERPEVSKIAIISSDYHIATGALFFEACFILNSDDPKKPVPSVVTNAAWKAPSGSLSEMFQAGGLIELSGDQETAFDIYHGNYSIKDLPLLEA